MYGTEVVEAPLTDGRVTFEAFAGIAPRLFPNVFAMIGRERDDATGAYIKWVPNAAQPRLVDASVLRFPVQTAEDEITQGLLASFGAGGEPGVDRLE
jgi:cytidine deaminase